MFTTRSVRRIAMLAIAVAAIATLGANRTVSAHTAAAGPPWISIETPVNPYDASTRDAFLVVHAFHHGVPTAFLVTGKAEGIVNGERRTMTLAFAKTSQSGAYALKKQWGDAGFWTLVITVHQETNDVAQALVEIGADGEVARVQVPTRAERNLKLPRQVSTDEVERALRSRASVVGTR